jgi:hypothetical protein
LTASLRRSISANADDVRESMFDLSSPTPNPDQTQHLIVILGV